MEEIQTYPEIESLSDKRIQLYKSAISVNALITILSPNSNEKLNANESETFTLEEYRKIILDFRMQNKDLILARVSTPDPYRQDLLYNYYYIASEVNKVLFKYESSRRLLHRMKVRNPLNNMYIIGQVHYFRIKKEEVDRAIVDCFFRDMVLKNEQRKNGQLSNMNQTFDIDITPEKNNISAFSAVFRTLTSETSLVSEKTSQSTPTKVKVKTDHPLDKLLRKKMRQKNKKKMKESLIDVEEETYATDTTADNSPQEILKMFDEGILDFPVIPEQYINKTDDLEESEGVNQSRPYDVLTTNVQNQGDLESDENSNFQNGQNSQSFNTKTVEFPVMLNYTAEFFATDDDFLLRNDIRDYFKKNSVDPSENFLFELDRTENDLFAILETPSSSENEEALGWKRMLTFHISLLLALVGIVVLLGLNPIAVIITLPLALFVFISFLCSLVYVLCIRRSSFDSLAVRSVDNMQI